MWGWMKVVDLAQHICSSVFCVLNPSSLFLPCRQPKTPPSHTHRCMFEQWVGREYNDFWGNPKSKLLLFISLSNTNIYNRPLRIRLNTLGPYMSTDLRYVQMEKVTPIRTEWFMLRFYICNLSPLLIFWRFFKTEFVNSKQILSKNMPLNGDTSFSKTKGKDKQSLKDRHGCFTICESGLRKSPCLSWECNVCVCLQGRIHTLKHTLHALRSLLTLSPGSIRSERPAVPPHTAMQMKRNALIKGQILEMRGQKEDRGSEC